MNAEDRTAAAQSAMTTTANGTNNSAHDMRSYYNYYLLPRPAAVAGSSTSQQQVKRNSMSPDNAGNSLRPVSSADGSPRRNSCTGMVQSTSCSLPLTPPRPSSRRNSAVTYLPDMLQGRSRSASAPCVCAVN